MRPAISEMFASPAHNENTQHIAGPRGLTKTLRAKLWDSLAVLGLIALIFALQLASGAYHSDFSADEDEPAHVVSSLMVYDYLAHDLPHNPLQFAKTYYLHYPKVAIGHWPPGFHTTEAFWMLLFGRTRMALVSLVGTVTAALAVSVFLWVRRDSGTLIAFLAAAVLATRPIVQFAAYSVQTDVLLTLFAFWAVAAYGLFLEQRRRRFLVMFFIFALCALAVHGRGAALAFVPGVAALFSGRSNRKWLAWVAILVLAAVAVFIPALVGQADPSTPASVFEHAWRTLYQLCQLVSWPVALVAAIGTIAVLRSRNTSPAGIAILALFVSNWIFASLVNVSFEERYLLVVIPFVTVLFAAGWRYAPIGLSKSPLISRLFAIVFVLIACGAILHDGLAVQKKHDLFCHTLVSDPAFPRSSSNVYLVAGGAIPEGSFIAEMALRDPQLKCFVLRASKVLAASSWFGGDYQLRFPTAQAVSAFLDRAHIGLVLLEPVKTPEHMQELTAALISRPDVWQLVSGLPSASGFHVFRRIGPMPEGAPEIRIDLRDKLGQEIVPGNRH